MKKQSRARKNFLLAKTCSDMSRVFETVSTLSDLRGEIKDKNARIKALESQVKSLQNDHP